MSYQEKATTLHESGSNCCQAVLGACCDHWNMDEDTAYRLGAFFGGGMRRGEVCGAVTGALMALGLEYGDENNRKSTKSVQGASGRGREKEERAVSGADPFLRRVS